MIANWIWCIWKTTWRQHRFTQLVRSVTSSESLADGGGVQEVVDQLADDEVVEEVWEIVRYEGVTQGLHHTLLLAAQLGKKGHVIMSWMTWSENIKALTYPLHEAGDLLLSDVSGEEGVNLPDDKLANGAAELPGFSNFKINHNQNSSHNVVTQTFPRIHWGVAVGHQDTSSSPPSWTWPASSAARHRNTPSQTDCSRSVEIYIENYTQEPKMFHLSKGISWARCIYKYTIDTWLQNLHSRYGALV